MRHLTVRCSGFRRIAVCLAAIISVWGCADTAPAGGGGDANNGGVNNGGANNGGANNGGVNNGGVNNDTNNDDANNDAPDAGEEVEDAQGSSDADDDATGGDSPDVGADVPGDAEEEECVAVTLAAENALLPVDIIWAVDASPSMGEEIDQIEQNLNSFAARIGASSLDYRVVVIGSDSEQCNDGRCYLPICVQPPLSAAPGCPDQDSERYLHVRQGVHSRDGLDVIINSADQWLSFLRPAALTHFVMVTDDNMGFGSDDEDFQAFMATHADRLGTTRFHSVVDLIGYEPGCGVFDDEPCSCGEERGQTYINLSEQTGGLVESVCQEDWTPIFEALETEVREGTALPCVFEVPDPGEGQTVNPAEVNVVFLSEDRTERTIVPPVNEEADCAQVSGWYYDDPDNPELIVLCPEACEVEPAAVEIEVGCRNDKPPSSMD